MERRDLVSGGLLGAAALFGTATAAEAAVAQERDDRAIAEAVDALRRSLESRQALPPELRRLREQQRTFLKAHDKYPDFIEVGLDVWDRVYDWHVEHLQMPAITRRADGRYLMPFMLTMLVLRPEQAEAHIGYPFDPR
ncbi:MAG: hypothetical protein FJW23_11235 [Acidimicrobiia bacterium]|nr:hypothetical protein [Acidimicrobiia bacterium]